MNTVKAVALSLCFLLAGCDNPAPRTARRAPIPVPYVLPSAEKVSVGTPIHWDASNLVFKVGDVPLRTEKLWTFEGSTDGFVALHATVAPAVGDGLEVTELAPDVLIRSPSGLKIDGATKSLVLVRVRRLAAGKAWDSTLFYATKAHGESPLYFARPILGGNPAVNQTALIVYDMHRLTAGGDDWKASTIDQIRLDLDDGPGGKLVIEQVAIARDPGGIF